MTIEQMIHKLRQAGLDAEKIVLSFGDVKTEAARVNHDYCGLYPGADTFKKYHKAAELAIKYGFNYEPRGHYTATFIY